LKAAKNKKLKWKSEVATTRIQTETGTGGGRGNEAKMSTYLCRE